MRIEGGGYRRDHLRALAQRVEVADHEVRIMGSKSDLLRTLAAISGVKSATGGVRGSVLDWRRERNWGRTFSAEAGRLDGSKTLWCIAHCSLHPSRYDEIGKPRWPIGLRHDASSQVGPNRAFFTWNECCELTNGRSGGAFSILVNAEARFPEGRQI
jgi:hypothetical protein